MYYKLEYSEKYLISEMVEEYDFGHINSVYNFRKLMYRNKDNLHYNGFKYPYRLKWLDYISCVFINGNFGLIISDAFKFFLKDFNLVKHSFRNSKLIKSNNSDRNYNVLLINEGVGDIVDFDQSDLYLFRGVRFPVEKVEANVEDLINHTNGLKNLKEAAYLRANKIVLKPSFDYDLFSVWNISNGVIVSEKLKLALEESSLTGFRFAESNVVKV